MTLEDVLGPYRIVLAAIMGGAIFGAAVALVQTPTFVSQMTISAVSSDEASIPSDSLLGALGGNSVFRAIGGLAGARDVEESGFAYFIALLHSDRVMRILIGKPEVAQELFPGEWDAQSETWHRAPGFKSGLRVLYRKVFFGQSYEPPSPARAKRAISRRFGVAFDLEQNTYNLRMKHGSCDEATALLAEIFYAGDAVMKAEKRARYLQNIALLREELANPANTSIRSDIANTLLGQQMRMIATESAFPIVARAIDGPGCEDNPHLPRPIPYMIGGVLAALIILLSCNAWRAWRRPLNRETQIGRGA